VEAMALHGEDLLLADSSGSQALIRIVAFVGQSQLIGCRPPPEA